MNDVAADIADRFRAAAMGMTPWQDALVRLEAATGSRSSQLGGFDRHGVLSFNIMSNVSADERAAYYALGGDHPTRNLRNRLVVDGPPLRCLIEEDFATPDIIARSEVYRDLFIPYDVEHCCMARLNAPGEAPAALALLRSRSAGPAGRDSRRLADAILPAIAGATRTALSLGRQADASMLHAVERVAGPTILLGAGMKLLSLSATAEDALRAATHLSVRGGRLATSTARDAAALDAAFAAITADGASARGNVPLLLHGDGDVEPLSVECVPLPRRPAGPLSVAVALLTFRSHRLAVAATTLAAAFGLTPAEAQVAKLLADGDDIAGIARRRGSTAATVRNQVKALFAKTGTNRQADLLLAIGRL